jgi:glucose-6-phosphate 1-dehydrogenase
MNISQQPVQIIEAPPRRRPIQPAPCTMVIFGARGDLTHRLVVPALYNLFREKMLPEDFRLIGIDHGENTTDGWRASLFDKIKSMANDKAAAFEAHRINENAWSFLSERMSYLRGDFNDPALYQQLASQLKSCEHDGQTQGNAIFYLAVADRFFGPIIDRLGAAGLVKQTRTDEGVPKCWRRVVIEKPFGHDLKSARDLNERILTSLNEDQIFRIDHFLGKDTVQAITAFRFANGLFEPIWNRDRIDHVQITVAETIGVEGRGRFYEQTGALRDMVPNHVFSLLSMVAMEAPTGFDATSIRNKKADVFAAMPPLDPAWALRGQYGAGTVLGKDVVAYRSEPNVDPASNIETFAAMKLEIDNWRWAGVPFYCRTGKRLSRRNTEIAIQFKQAPYLAFQDTPVDALRPNWLVLSIAPEEGISLQFEVKRPGPVVDLSAVRMEFKYADWFAKEPHVGYETLLYDVMIGDPTLFMRADMIEHAWRIVQPVLDAWASPPPDFPNYEAGSEGPAASDELIGRDGGRQWRPVEPLKSPKG